MSADRRWSVEIRRDVFEDVGAPRVAIEYGALVFRDSDGRIAVAYAPGQWLTVTPEAS